MTTHKWQFAARFRRHAFGWRSDTPMQRIKEALAEIKLIAKKDPVLAAEGAVILLEKLSPALEQVDSSSGAIGSAVNRAIETLVPIIAKANVDQATRQRWLERLWQAFQDDGIPYIESLGDDWGDLCASPELASQWADALLPTVENNWSPAATSHSYFKGTPVCMALLYAAGRYDELLVLIEKAPYKWWHYRHWGVQALAAMGKKAEAIRYAEESRGVNEPVQQIAQACEAILLSSGMLDEAYSRYALDANQSTTNLATFRAIVKKYPHKPAADILRDLIKSTPGAEGKWFAAAKTAGLFDVATELATRSSADPRTLARAARDFAEKRPDFAIACGMAALHGISLGYGYEITGVEVLDAYTAVMQAASGSGVDAHRIKARIQEMIDGSPKTSRLLKEILARHLLA
jgi:hypothetical protein